MKILRLTHSANPRGGGVIEGVRVSTEELISRGHEVDIISLNDPEEAKKFELTIPIKAIGPGKTGYGYCPNLDSWLAEHLTRYDCAIIEGMWQYHGFALWRACRRLGKAAPPYYVFSHGMLDPWFKRTYPLKHLKKWLYWPWAEYRVLRDAQAVLFTAEEERRLARESFWLYRCHERIAHYGVRLPEYSSDEMVDAWRSQSPVGNGKPYLLFLGRLHVKKGPDLLIQAYRQIKKKHPHFPDLVLAGPAQNEHFAKRLRELANHDPQIHFPGMIQGAAKWGALREAQAMVLPSHQENFGIVVAEALAMGAPVLISNKINIWREIQNAQAGIVEDDSLDGALRLLDRFAAMDNNQRHSMSTHARECFQNEFSIERSVNSLLSILEEGLSKQS